MSDADRLDRDLERAVARLRDARRSVESAELNLARVQAEIAQARRERRSCAGPAPGAPSASAG